MTKSIFIKAALFITALTAGCGPGMGGTGAGGGGDGAESSSSGGDRCAGVVCAAADQCHTAGTCDPQTGMCSNPSAADGTMCNDGNACSQADACQAGACVGQPVTCKAEDECHAAGTCDPATGQCSNPTVADGSACTCGACSAGVCGAHTLGVTSISGSNRPIDIAIDANNIYFANISSGFAGKALIGSLPKIGGPMAMELATNLTNASGLTVSGATVYFVAGGSGVWTVPANGSAKATVLVPDLNISLGSIATDDVNLYWTASKSSSVMTVPIAGGMPKAIATSQSGPTRIATDGTNVYWINDTEKAVKQMPIAGGPITTLASNQQKPMDLAVDATSVYFTDYMAGNVLKVPIGGGMMTTIASGQANPAAITLVGSMVYWTNYKGGGVGGSVAKASSAGGGMVTIIPGTNETGPFPITHDASCLYWVNAAGAAVRRAPQ